MKNTDCRRSAIQNAIAPVIGAALKTIPTFNIDRAEDQRRLMRALVRIGARVLLAAGVHPDAILGHCVEAIGRELEAQQGAPLPITQIADALQNQKMLN